eukprot:TRINITY_DN7313_c0_g1_i1.p1 TRINITY_DN7313_c0_g1~~TRINITY_DN7313_c0_g1_i1.p1  ORF type:complete len:969 (-),score=153.51 TRINITY_DN7313_c0_g1_i1:6-2912(-)
MSGVSWGDSRHYDDTNRSAHVASFSNTRTHQSNSQYGAVGCISPSRIYGSSPQQSQERRYPPRGPWHDEGASDENSRNERKSFPSHQNRNQYQNQRQNHQYQNQHQNHHYQNQHQNRNQYDRQQQNDQRQNHFLGEDGNKFMIKSKDSARQHQMHPSWHDNRVGQSADQQSLRRAWSNGSNYGSYSKGEKGYPPSRNGNTPLYATEGEGLQRFQPKSAFQQSHFNHSHRRSSTNTSDEYDQYPPAKLKETNVPQPIYLHTSRKSTSPEKYQTHENHTSQSHRVGNHQYSPSDFVISAEKEESKEIHNVFLEQINDSSADKVKETGSERLKIESPTAIIADHQSMIDQYSVTVNVLEPLPDTTPLPQLPQSDQNFEPVLRSYLEALDDFDSSKLAQVEEERVAALLKEICHLKSLPVNALSPQEQALDRPKQGLPQVLPQAVSSCELSTDRLKREGFRVPYIITDGSIPGFQIPKGKKLTEIAELVGKETQFPVIDVCAQVVQDNLWTMQRWVEYFLHPQRKACRSTVLNCLSLEISETNLAEFVNPPTWVNEIDIYNRYWPWKHDVKQESQFLKDKARRSQVRKYLLMSMGRSYTDFHVDASGSSVWYHIVQGEKWFVLYPPIQQNVEAYRAWNLLGCPTRDKSEFEFCQAYYVRLKAGQTLLLPSGWIHSVFTPVDSLVFGGNFIHLCDLTMVFTIRQIELDSNTDAKFQYPFLEELLLHGIKGRLEDHLIKGVVLHDTEVESIIHAFEHLQAWCNDDSMNISNLVRLPKELRQSTKFQLPDLAQVSKMFSECLGPIDTDPYLQMLVGRMSHLSWSSLKKNRTKQKKGSAASAQLTNLEEGDQKKLLDELSTTKVFDDATEPASTPEVYSGSGLINTPEWSIGKPPTVLPADRSQSRSFTVLKNKRKQSPSDDIAPGYLAEGYVRLRHPEISEAKLVGIHDRALVSRLNDTTPFQFSLPRILSQVDK